MGLSNKIKNREAKCYKSGSSDYSYLVLSVPSDIVIPDDSPSKYGINENEFESDPSGSGSPRRLKIMFLLKFSLILTVFLALGSSIWWTIFISTSSRSLVAHDDRRLREELVSDLWDIEKLSTVSLRLKVLEFCSQRSENYVPCFNVSKNLGHYDRNCAKERRENCLVYPPAGYKIPLRWPTGRDAIWGVNVKITAQEVLSSGSLTKRGHEIFYKPSPIHRAFVFPLIFPFYVVSG